MRQDSSTSCRTCSTSQSRSRVTSYLQAIWTVQISPRTQLTTDFPPCYNVTTSSRSTPVQSVLTRLPAAGECSIWSSSTVADSTTEVVFSDRELVTTPVRKTSSSKNRLQLSWLPAHGHDGFQNHCWKSRYLSSNHHLTRMMQPSSSRRT